MSWTRSLFALAVLTLPATALADPRDDARRHFKAGLEAAKSQQFQKALDEFLLAQDIYPHPATIYNIARAYGDLGDLEQAIAYYEQFQRLSPEKAEDVEPMLVVLRDQLAQSQAPPPSEETATPSVGTPGGGSATREELDRLAALANELATIAAALEERGAAAPVSEGPLAVGVDGEPVADAEPTEDTGEPAQTPEVPAVLPEGDFLDIAYERTVVSASRYGQEPIDSPSTITVLTSEDIRLSGLDNIPDLLRRVVGVEVMQLSASQPDLSIRGFNRKMSNKVLVLIDGRPIYVDTVGTPLWATIPVTMEEIERIEIIRGPGSAVYGANALTGVVNILTRAPGEGGSSFTAKGGSQGNYRISALTSGRLDTTSYRVSAEMAQVGRWSTKIDVDDPTLPGRFWSDDTDLDSISSKRVQANLRIDQQFLGKGLASLTAGVNKGFTEFYALGLFDDYVFDYEHHYVRGDAAYGPVHLRTFWNHNRGGVAPWVETATTDRDRKANFSDDVVDIELEGNQEFETGPVKHRLNLGVSYRYKRAQWDYIGDEPIEQNHFAGFVQEDARIGPVGLVASLRLDRHPLIDDLSKTISPRGAAIVRLSDTTSVRLTGGTAFRSPTHMESYIDLPQQGSADAVFVTIKGDQQLVPERITTVELGAHDESTSFHTADVTLFYNHVNELIYLTSLEPALNAYDPVENGWSAGTTTFTNLTETYDAFGVEAEARAYPLDGLDIYANGTWHLILEDDGTDVVEDMSTSRVKVNAGIAYRTPWRFDVSADVHWVSPQTWRLREFDDSGNIVIQSYDLPARTILSARAGVRPLDDDTVEIGVSLWNALALATENRFREHPTGQLVGPRVTGEVTWRF